MKRKVKTNGEIKNCKYFGIFAKNNKKFKYIKIFILCQKINLYASYSVQLGTTQKAINRIIMSGIISRIILNVNLQTQFVIFVNNM